MAPSYSGSLGFQVGLPSSVEESEGMTKRGHAGSEAVVLAVVDLGRDDVVAGVELGRDDVVTGVDLGIDVGTFVDAGSDFCRVFSSCVLSSGFVLSGSLSPSPGSPSPGSPSPGSPSPPPPPPPPPVPPQKGQIQNPLPPFPPPLQKGQMQKPLVPREPRASPKNTPSVPMITAPVAQATTPAELVVASEVVTVVVPVKLSKPDIVCRVSTMVWPLMLSVINEEPDVSNALRSEDMGGVKLPGAEDDDFGGGVMIGVDEKDDVVGDSADAALCMAVVALDVLAVI